jgi:hypothetical protein
MEWVDLGTASNIRWEVIGIAAAICGSCANCLASTDPIFKEHNVDRSTLPTQMSYISQACLSFSRECEALDDMFIWLVAENAILTSSIKGEDSYLSYHEAGELVTAVISMGFHQEIKTNDRVPFFLAELRKKVRSTAYTFEISGATFLGRPPRISHRYTILEPPLDISDSQLVLERQDIDPILATLDKNGFNSTGQIHRATWLRAWLPFAARREDILDLSIGHYTRDEILLRAEMIEQKSEENWAMLPEYFRSVRYDGIPRTGKPINILYRGILRMGSWANDLLLQRVLIRKAGASSEKLIHTARTVFKDVLEITQRQDMVSCFQLDMTSVLVVHGLRTSAILAVELLKQEQLPVYPKEPLLPRSQTIRDLSVFAARLGAVYPSDGMYSMCEQGQKIITRILDKILAPPNAAEQQIQPNYHPNPPQGYQPGLGEMDIDVMGNETTQIGGSFIPGPLATCDMNFGAQDPIMVHDNDFTFMQWLENMDWEKPSPWIGL